MELDEKIKEVFSEESVYKDSEKYSIFEGLNLPSFVKDWLIKKFTTEYDEIDENNLKRFIKNNLPKKDEDIKLRLMAEGREKTLLARILIEPDVPKGIIKFSIPDIELKKNECRIPDYIVKEYDELKKGGELWGIVTLSYLYPESNEKGYVILNDFKTFKPYIVDFDYFSSKREEFTIEEWVDLLIRSMEYNPDGFDSFTQKLNFITRLLVFVEPNLNMMELAPKGTGKSYVFSNLSKYGWIISGGTITRAKLLYDISRESPGLIKQYDFLAMDEIETIKFHNENEIQGALKSYLENGRYTVSTYNGESDCGLIVLGNIPLNENKKPINKQYFAELHKFFKDSALLDRFHGFIEGWQLPRVNEDMKLKGYGLNVEYFSEILKTMRNPTESAQFSKITEDLLYIPSGADSRDTKAIKKIATAYLKLLFPNVRSAHDVDKKDFERYCLKPAIKMRGIIKHQISLIDQEFTSDVPNIKVKDEVFN